MKTQVKFLSAVLVASVLSACSSVPSRSNTVPVSSSVLLNSNTTPAVTNTYLYKTSPRGGTYYINSNGNKTYKKK